MACRQNFELVVISFEVLLLSCGAVEPVSTESCSGLWWLLAGQKASHHVVCSCSGPGRWLRWEGCSNTMVAPGPTGVEEHWRENSATQLGTIVCG